MANFNPNRVLHGNEGTAWFNGKKLTTLQSIEAKVAADYEDINNCGDPATYRIYNGYSGEGTFTALKIVIVGISPAGRRLSDRRNADYHDHHRTDPEGHE